MKHLSIPGLSKIIASFTIFLLLVLVNTSPAQQKDYSKGFAKFYKLGLPNVKDATYVKLDTYNSNYYDNDFSGLYDLKLKGNAWMLNENKTNKSTFVVNGCKITEVYDNVQLSKERMEKAKKEAKTSKIKSRHRVYSENSDGKTGGEWTPVSLEKDIIKVKDYLKKQEEEKLKNKFNRFSYSDSGGKLFIKAIHYYSKGYTNEANEITEKIFELGGGPRKVIISALNILADSQYNETISKFFRNGGSFETLVNDLEKITARFPAGWSNKLAIDKLVNNIKAQTKQTTPYQIADNKLSENDKDILNAIVSTNELYTKRYNYNGWNSLWILSRGKNSDSNSPITKIYAGGKSSIPLLLAMLDDNSFTKIDIYKLSSSHSYYSSGSNNEMTEERITQRYNSLHRPATISDIARVILTKILLPENENEYSARQRSIDDIRIATENWQEENKDKSLQDLAHFYLNDGSKQQQRAALSYLIKKGNEKDIKAIEEHLLESDNIMMDSYTIREYVTAREEKAKDFVDKLERKLKEDAENTDDDNNDDMFNDKDSAKRIEQMITSLRNIVSAEPAINIIANLVSGSNSWETSAENLYARIGKETPENALTMLLDGALKTKDTKLSQNLIYAAMRTPYAGMYSRNNYEENDEPAELDIKTHAVQWKKLLSDTRPIKDKGNTISTASAWAIEALYNEDDERPQSYTLYYSLGNRILPLVQARCKARLEGKTGSDIPQFPDAENVTEAQRQAITKKLISTDSGKIKDSVNALSLSEILAVTQISITNDTLKAALMPIAQCITSITNNSDIPLDKSIITAKGESLNINTVKALYKFAENAAKENKALQVSIARNAGLSGFEITIDKSTIKENRMSDPFGDTEDDNEPTPANVTGWISTPDKRLNTIWEFKDKTDNSANKSIDIDDDDLLDDMSDEIESDEESIVKENQNDFWKYAESIVNGKGNICTRASIIFMSNPENK